MNVMAATILPIGLGIGMAYIAATLAFQASDVAKWLHIR
jgi:hypothetical protein